MACKKHGKACGGPTLTIEEMKKRRAQGAQLLINNSEFQNWSSGLKNSIRLFEELD